MISELIIQVICLMCLFLIPVHKIDSSKGICLYWWALFLQSFTTAVALLRYFIY